jgi:rSAM/selenodomain-associated transferase 1
VTIVIAVMAKDPRGQDVKTRLAPRLPPALRSQLYQAFLADKLAAVRAVQGARCAILYTPSTSRAWFEHFAGPEVELYPQCGGALGARIVGAFAALFDDYADGVILTDSDTPNLPQPYLQASVEALRSGCELVLGPTADGGYYLVGLQSAQPAIFEGVAWSSRSTLLDTVKGAERIGVHPHLLPAWYDIDEPLDLERLVRELASDSGSGCAHTRAALAAIRPRG